MRMALATNRGTMAIADTLRLDILILPLFQRSSVGLIECQRRSTLRCILDLRCKTFGAAKGAPELRTSNRRSSRTVWRDRKRRAQNAIIGGTEFKQTFRGSHQISVALDRSSFSGTLRRNRWEKGADLAA